MRARLAPTEPGGAEPVSEVRGQLGLERPRAQIVGAIEAGIDVDQVLDWAGVDADGGPVVLAVALRHAVEVRTPAELDLVQELAGVASDQVQPHDGRLPNEVARSVDVEPVAPKPAHVVDEELHEEGESLVDRVITELAGLDRQRATRVGEELGMPRFMEQVSPVLDAS